MPFASMGAGAVSARTSLSHKVLSVLMSICLVVSMTVIPSAASASASSTGAGYVESSLVTITDAPATVELNGSAQDISLTVSPTSADLQTGCGYCPSEAGCGDGCLDSWGYCSCTYSYVTRTTYVSVVSVADESVATATASGTTLTITPAEGATAGATTTVQVRAQLDAPSPDYDSTQPNAYGRCSQTYTITVTIAASDDEEEGEADLTISTVADFEAFAASLGEGNSYADQTIVLANDIDLTDSSITSPIAASGSNYFAGTLDGAGHSLTYNITATAANAGLFTYVKGATFKNLVLNGSVTSSKTGVGAIAGTHWGVTFENVVNNVDVTCTLSSSGTAANVGGFVGTNTSTTGYTSSFKNCVYGTVTISASTEVAGGFIGVSQNIATFERCAFTGTIVATATSTNAGGFVGSLKTKADSTFTDCYSAGTVGGKLKSGGFVAHFNIAASFTNCYSASSINTDATYYGAIIGYLYAAVATVDNVYYLNSTSTQAAKHSGDQYSIEDDVEAVSSGVLQSNDMIDLLNGEGDAWVGDDETSPINNGYPVLAWQLATDSDDDSQPEETTYTVTLDTNGGTLRNTSLTYTASTEATALPTPTREGYTFLGWQNASSEIVTTYGGGETGDYTLTATWKATPYTITLDPNGGTVESTSIEYSVETASTALPTPERAGYTFAGWQTAAGATVTTYGGGEMGDYTLTATWTATAYTITFDLNGGTMKYTSIEYTVATNSTALPQPSRDYYTFAGWRNDAGDIVDMYGGGEMGD